MFSERNVACRFYPFVGLSYSAYVLRTAYQVSCFFAFVKIWDCSISGRELLNLKGHNQDVFTCMFSPDDSNVISCSADKTVKVLLQ